MDHRQKVVAAAGIEQAERRSSKPRDFSDWARANKIAFAIRVVATKNAERDAQCLEVSRRNLLYLNDAARSNYLEGDDIDAIFLSAYAAGYDYVLVLAAGAYLLDKPGIRDCLEAEFKNEFFFLGHILDNGDAYFSVHRQCIFVNLRVWNEIGRPEFGRASSDPKLLHVPLRSPENFHDTHTPIWVTHSMERREYQSQREGWNFVASGLDCGKRIAPFSPQIRQRKRYLYPDHDDYGFKLGSWRRRATTWAEMAWVINTEELNAEIKKFSSPVDVAIGVASGLKMYLILDRLGYTERTRVHCVDVSTATLQFKHWLIKNWDGVDYPAAVERWNTQVAGGTMSMEKVRAAAEEFYLEFGGSKRFQEKWSEFRALPHTFTRLDLLTTDIENVIDMVPTGSSQTVLWLSNIFHCLYTHTLLRHDDVASMYQCLLAQLRSRSPHAALICNDPHGYPIAARVKDIPSTVTDPIIANQYLPLKLLKFWDREIDDLRRVTRAALEEGRES